MFAEMRALADQDKDISPEEIIRMATVNGARALGSPEKSASFRRKQLPT